MSPTLFDPVRLGGLNEADAGTFHQGGEHVHLDYPTLNA